MMFVGGVGCSVIKTLACWSVDRWRRMMCLQPSVSQSGSCSLRGHDRRWSKAPSRLALGFIAPRSNPCFPTLSVFAHLLTQLRRSPYKLDQPFRVVVGNRSQPGRLEVRTIDDTGQLAVGANTGDGGAVVGQATGCRPDRDGVYPELSIMLSWNSDGVVNYSALFCGAQETEFSYPDSLSLGLDYILLDPGVSTLDVERIEWDLRNNPDLLIVRG